jgi:hypothetical protein
MHQHGHHLTYLLHKGQTAPSPAPSPIQGHHTTLAPDQLKFLKNRAAQGLPRFLIAPVHPSHHLRSQNHQEHRILLVQYKFHHPHILQTSPLPLQAELHPMQLVLAKDMSMDYHTKSIMSPLMNPTPWR